MKITKMPIKRGGIRKTWYINTTEYYSARKKDEMPFAATRMTLETVILSEVSRRKTDIV